jgi:hypothetical protein
MCEVKRELPYLSVTCFLMGLWSDIGNQSIHIQHFTSEDKYFSGEIVGSGKKLSYHVFYSRDCGVLLQVK